MGGNRSRGYCKYLGERLGSLDEVSGSGGGEKLLVFDGRVIGFVDGLDEVW